MSVLFKLKDHFKENQLYLNRTVAAITVVFMLLCILIARLMFLQIYQHDLYATLARNNQVRMVSVPATRGLIFDRNGILLAENVPVYSLEVIPSHVKNLTALIKQLSKIITITDDDIKTFNKQLKYKGPFERIPLRTKLTEQEVAIFSIEKYQFPEVEVGAHLSRNYPKGKIMSHVMGYIGPISEHDLTTIDIAKYRGTYVIGKSGIEKSYEDILHGKVGYEQVETDARGRIIRVLDRIAPIPGQNIYLSIDSKLQTYAYMALGSRHGAVVAIDIETGGILAMLSKPGYDPNIFVQGIDHITYKKLQQATDQPLFNRAISGQYPPGSIVKPLVAIQALENNIISPSTRIYDPGYYKLHDEGRLFRDWRPEGHGYINLENAIAESCTTYFYFVSDKLGIDKIHEIYTKFGLGQVTGIDIAGEATGLAPSISWKRNVKQQNWFHGETLITGIGQGYTTVTPLQMAHIAATLASHGIRRRPNLVKSLQLANQEPKQQQIVYYPRVKLANEQNWQTVINGMKKVVHSARGTARRINQGNMSFSIAGKTGTAQVFSLKQDEIYDVEKIKEHLRDHAWFIAFAPIKNPKIAVAVLIEHGKGSSDLAKKLLEKYFRSSSYG